MRIRKTRCVPVVLFVLYAGAALAVTVNVNFVDSQGQAANVKMFVLDPGPKQTEVKNEENDDRAIVPLLESGKTYRVEAYDADGKKYTSTFIAPAQDGNVTVSLAPAAVAAGTVGLLWDSLSESKYLPNYRFYGQITFGRVDYSLPQDIVNVNRDPFLMTHPGASYDGSFDDSGTSVGLNLGGEWRIPDTGQPILPGVNWFVGWRAGIAMVPDFSSTIFTDNPTYTPDGVNYARLEERFNDQFDGDLNLSLGGTVRAAWDNGWQIGAGLGLRRVEFTQTSTAQAFPNGVALEPVTASRDLNDTAWYWDISVGYDLAKVDPSFKQWRAELGYNMTKLDALPGLDEDYEYFYFGIAYEFMGQKVATTHQGP